MPGKRERQNSTKIKSRGIICIKDVDNFACFKTFIHIDMDTGAKPSVQAIKNNCPFRADSRNDREFP